MPAPPSASQRNSRCGHSSSAAPRPGMATSVLAAIAVDRCTRSDTKPGVPLPTNSACSGAKFATGASAKAVFCDDGFDSDTAVPRGLGSAKSACDLAPVRQYDSPPVACRRHGIATSSTFSTAAPTTRAVAVATAKVGAAGVGAVGAAADPSALSDVAGTNV